MIQTFCFIRYRSQIVNNNSLPYPYCRTIEYTCIALILKYKTQTVCTGHEAVEVQDNRYWKIRMRSFLFILVICLPGFLGNPFTLTICTYLFKIVFSTTIASLFAMIQVCLQNIRTSNPRQEKDSLIVPFAIPSSLIYSWDFRMDRLMKKFLQESARDAKPLTCTISKFAMEPLLSPWFSL